MLGRCAKELMRYVTKFKEELSDTKAHPAHMVLDQLAGGCGDSNVLHAEQLARWYQDYANMRGIPHLFKSQVDPCRKQQDLRFMLKRLPQHLPVRRSRFR